jgi:hypothetical protein
MIPVPDRDQDRDKVLASLQEKLEARDTLILPVTAIVETGNHISHLDNGHQRRQTASTFKKLILLVIAEKAPWHLHSFSWDKNFLSTLLDGAGTGSSLIEHAVAKMGCGDLCILAERDIYRKRTAIQDVRIWTLDHQLASHNQPSPE